MTDLCMLGILAVGFALVIGLIQWCDHQINK